MDNRMKGCLLGVAGVLLWFSPFVNIEFMGQTGMYQTGQHIGGIAYLLLLGSAVYAALAWQEKHELAMIPAGVALGVCLLFAVQANTSIAWGLIMLLIVSGVSLYFSYHCKRLPVQSAPTEKPV